MTGIEYLKQIRDIKVYIISLERQIQEIETQLTRTKQRVKDINVQTSLPSDPMADLIIKKVEIEERIVKRINYQWDIISKGMDLLDKMDSQEFKKLLSLRYINCMTYKEMMDIMDVSRATIARRLMQAEKAFDDLYELIQNETT